MKPIRIKIKGKTYKLRTQAVAVLLLILALLIVLVVVGIRNASHIQDQTPVPTATPSASYDASAGKIEETEYEGTILIQTEDAGPSYIENTLFLGDSNTARFLKVTDQNGKTFTNKENTIGVVGMGIDAISSLPCMDFSTGRMTMPQAVSILQPQRIIITMGTNNLSGSSTDTDSFISRYEVQLKAIEKAYPYADLIVNSIPPVAKIRSYTNVTMTQIDAYNRAIADLCSRNDWKYLNSAEVLKNEKDGYAKDGYTISDGLHLSQKGLDALFSYIRTHSLITEDERPKPLNAIPTILGVPDGLIRTDPLTDEEFTEDPSEETYEEPQNTATPAPTPDEKTESGCKALNRYWYNNTCNPVPDPNTKEGCEYQNKVWNNGVCQDSEPDPVVSPEQEGSNVDQTDQNGSGDGEPGTNPEPGTDQGTETDPEKTDPPVPDSGNDGTGDKKEPAPETPPAEDPAPTETSAPVEG